MGRIRKFVERMLYWVNVANMGYDQFQRWDFWPGGECDCSSLVIHCLQEAGIDTNGATYTGDMSECLCATGKFRRLPPDIGKCQPGDILLNDNSHVCAVVNGFGWATTIAQASIDERGKVSGGQAGDQSGYETNTKPVYDYPWDCILRYVGDDSEDADELEVDGYLGPKSVKAWQRQCGTTMDGVVSGQGRTYAEFYPRLTSVTFEGGGSQLMEVVQRAVGVSNPTGIIADVTIMRLQVWLKERGYALKGALAGVLDAPTARAVQMSLNDGMWR